jgi:hypothetical protein
MLNLLQKNPKHRINVIDFVNHIWFNNSYEKKTIYFQNLQNVESYINYCRPVTGNTNSSVSGEYSDCIFSMEEDEFNVKKTHTTIVNSHYLDDDMTDDDYEENIDDESDKFVIISNQSKFIQTIPRKSITDRNIEGITRIYNSLKDSLSFMFSPKSL